MMTESNTQMCVYLRKLNMIVKHITWAYASLEEKLFLKGYLPCIILVKTDILLLINF